MIFAFLCFLGEQEGCDVPYGENRCVRLALLRHELQYCWPCSVLMNQYRLNKVSLKRSTHKARLCVDGSA